MLLASPMEDTVTSTLLPIRAKGGRLQVTMTAATLFTFVVLGSTLIPMVSSMLARDWFVKIVFDLSPVPERPVTSP